MSKAAYRKRIALSKDQQEILIRDSVKRYGHHPLKDVLQIIREKHGIAADESFVRSLMGKES